MRRRAEGGWLRANGDASSEGIQVMGLWRAWPVAASCYMLPVSRANKISPATCSPRMQ